MQEIVSELKNELNKDVVDHEFVKNLCNIALTKYHADIYKLSVLLTKNEVHPERSRRVVYDLLFDLKYS